MRGRDYLNWFAVSQIKRRAQGLVTPSDLAERFLQRDRIEFSLQRDSAHKIVSRTARLELVKEPESPLREGQGRGLALFAERNLFGVRDADTLLAQQCFQEGSSFRGELECSF
jgi:hypothetical protein